MKRLRLFLAALVLIVVIPVAGIAGHAVIGGAWCDCGSSGCICDPGETPGGGGLVFHQPKHSPARSSSPDAGVSVLLITLAFFVWMRSRQV